MLVDNVTKRLWLGHADGRVSAYGIDTPGRSISASRKHFWQAHKAGAVTAICRTAWGDIWTGSSRGVIRVWSADPSSYREGLEYHGPVRELRRVNGAKPHSSPVKFLIAPSSGQVVWSSGDKSIALWCAFSGRFLGVLKSGLAPDLSLAVPSAVPVAGDLGVSLSIRASPSVSVGDVEERRMFIDPAKGLPLDGEGHLIGRASNMRKDHFSAEQEAWFSASDRYAVELLGQLAAHGGSVVGHAGKAAQSAGKFLGKLGQKLARNLVKDDGHGGVAGLDGGSGSKPVPRGGPAGGYGPAASLVDDDEDEGSGNEAPNGKAGRAPSGGVKALVSGIDGCVWAGYKEGQLEKYSSCGKLLLRKEMPEAVTSLVTAGLRTWVGLASGTIRVYGDGLLREWPAHAGAVVAMCMAGSRVYTLGSDGSLYGWSSNVPSARDTDARVGFMAKQGSLVARAAGGSAVA
eukprot:jgi/Botrbrau1/17721/Bobra.0166s0143.1